jgi:hypothetical protein
MLWSEYDFDDAQKIVECAVEIGLDISEAEACLMWLTHSDNQGAGWLALPDHEKLTKIIERFASGVSTWGICEGIALPKDEIIDLDDLVYVGTRKISQGES